MADERFSSRRAFVLASIGAAVGLGNALRFPGLCAKYGGGAFMLIYFIALAVMGVPLLNAEIALGRKVRGGAPVCMRMLRRRAEPAGWAACFNSLVVSVIYAGLLGWILFMAVKIVPLSESAAHLSADETGGYFFGVLEENVLSPAVLGCILFGWAVMYFLLRGGAKRISGAARVTVIVPVAILSLLFVRGLGYGASGEALRALFVPDFSAFGDADMWINAFCQVFFSLSVLAGIMPAYGAYLPEGTSIFSDSLIIAAADFFVSALSSAVLFTTLYGCGLEDMISSSGMVTAFRVYPVALTRAFGTGSPLNAVTGVLFYLSLAMMAAQSAVSMAEAAVNPLSERLRTGRKRIAALFCLAGAAVTAVFASPLALTALETADRFANCFDILFLGVAECLALSFGAERVNLAGEINRYGGRLKMPRRTFYISLKLSALVITALAVRALADYIAQLAHGDLPLLWQALFGWSVTFSVFAAGLRFSGVRVKNFLKIFPKKFFACMRRARGRQTIKGRAGARTRRAQK